jgi:hypothetical protein
VNGDFVAVIATVAALCGLAGAIIGLVNGRRAMVAAQIAKESAAVVQKISVEVDGRLSEFIAREAQMTAREAQLVGKMRQEGIDIPKVPGKLCGTGMQYGPGSSWWGCWGTLRLLYWDSPPGCWWRTRCMTLGKFTQQSNGGWRNHGKRGNTMPYEAKKKEGSEDWVVINTQNGEVKATHQPPEAEEKAKNQVRLLEAIENDPEWEASDG